MIRPVEYHEATAIILSIAGLCFSGSFSAIQSILPTVQAQTQALRLPALTRRIEHKDGTTFPASNKPEEIATLAYIWGFPILLRWKDSSIM